MAQLIQPVKVERDVDGMWTHPDFPAWDEDVSEVEMYKWFSENNINHHVIWFQYEADVEMYEKWFNEDDDFTFSQWKPTCDIKGSFLLSIHDTEDGPVALFAYPLTSPSTKLHQLIHKWANRTYKGTEQVLPIELWPEEYDFSTLNADVERLFNVSGDAERFIYSEDEAEVEELIEQLNLQDLDLFLSEVENSSPLNLIQVVSKVA